LQDAVERIRAECPAFGDGNIERRQKLPQRSDLLRGRLVVDAIDQRDVAALASFRCRHVGKDHELFYQPMRFKPRRHDNTIDRGVGFEQDLAFRQVEIERAAFVARTAHGAVSGIKRLKNGLNERLRHFIRATGDGKLRLFVMKARRGAHQHAMEGV